MSAASISSSHFARAASNSPPATAVAAAPLSSSASVNHEPVTIVHGLGFECSSSAPSHLSSSPSSSRSLFSSVNHRPVSRGHRLGLGCSLQFRSLTPSSPSFSRSVKNRLVTRVCGLGSECPSPAPSQFRSSPSCSSSFSASVNHLPVSRGHGQGFGWSSSGGTSGATSQVEEDRRSGSSSCCSSASFGPSGRSCRSSGGMGDVDGKGGPRVAAGTSGRGVLEEDGEEGEYDGWSATGGQLQRRREIVGVVFSWIVSLGFAAAALADEEQDPAATTTTEAAKAGLIEKLLERSKANKARYDQERLDAYYKRNYRDYFDFLKGSIVNKDKDKLTEAEQGILRWLEKNK